MILRLPLRFAAATVALAATLVSGAPAVSAEDIYPSGAGTASHEVAAPLRAVTADVEADATARAADLAAQSSVIAKADSDAKAAAQAAADAKAKQAKLGYDPSVTDPRSIAKQLMANKYGWGDDQFACFDKIITQESKWSVTATNASSGAYGIPQALPGSKMASAGADWKTNPATQITWALGYVQSRYSTPCAAWSFKQSTGWY